MSEAENKDKSKDKSKELDVCVALRADTHETFRQIAENLADIAKTLRRHSAPVWRMGTPRDLTEEETEWALERINAYRKRKAEDGEPCP